jgi:hypothetical protein
LIAEVAIFELVIAEDDIFGPVIEPLAILGFGYVPIKSPPAFPLGGRFVGITPLAIFDEVIAPSAITGFGYVPLKSPPAFPLGGSEVGMTPAANFDAVITPIAIVGLG